MNPFKQYFHGIKSIEEWFEDGGHVVSWFLAQQRTDVCLKCPMNKPGNVIVNFIAHRVKRRMEKKLQRPLSTIGIAKLKTCSACKCPLATKVFFPIQSVLPRQKDRKDYHPDCWILSES